MKGAMKALILFGIGGFIYYMIECIWRGHSHWTMGIVGGICFLLIGMINEYFTWEMKLWKQCVIGAVTVTVIEFISGVILNISLGMNIWDYSDVPFNILGQVCLPYCFLWVALSAVAIILDDYLRYWLFGEEKPRYRL